MASGKTTLGRALARATGRQFYDLDFCIEQRFRRKVSEIFAEYGEAEFRRMESSMLREIGELEDVIVSCGGGTPCHNDNMAYMNGRGVTLWLKATVEATVRRLLAAGGKRPIVARYSAEELPAFVSGHLREREPFYSQAQYHIESSDLESRAAIAQSVSEVRDKLGI